MTTDPPDQPVPTNKPTETGAEVSDAFLLKYVRTTSSWDVNVPTKGEAADLFAVVYDESAPMEKRRASFDVLVSRGWIRIKDDVALQHTHQTFSDNHPALSPASANNVLDECFTARNHLAQPRIPNKKDLDRMLKCLSVAEHPEMQRFTITVGQGPTRATCVSLNPSVSASGATPDEALKNVYEAVRTKAIANLRECMGWIRAVLPKPKESDDLATTVPVMKDSE